MRNSLLTLAVLSAFHLAAQDRRYPPPNGYVNDFVGAIPDDIEQSLEAELSAFQNSSRFEVAVAVVMTLGDESESDYTVNMFNEWGVGSSETDGGVLVMWCPSERAYWTTTGYGAEEYLPDARIAQLQRSVLLPELKSGNGPTGLAAFVRALKSELDPVVREHRAAVEAVQREARARARGEAWSTFLLIILGLAVIGGVVTLLVFAYRRQKAEDARRQVVETRLRALMGQRSAADKTVRDAAEQKHPMAAALAKAVSEAKWPQASFEDVAKLSTPRLLDRLKAYDDLRGVVSLVEKVREDIDIVREIQKARRDTEESIVRLRVDAKRAEAARKRVLDKWPNALMPALPVQPVDPVVAVTSALVSMSEKAGRWEIPDALSMLARAKKSMAAAQAPVAEVLKEADRHEAADADIRAGRVSERISLACSMAESSAAWEGVSASTRASLTAMVATARKWAPTGTGGPARDLDRAAALIEEVNVWKKTADEEHSKHAAEARKQIAPTYSYSYGHGHSSHGRSGLGGFGGFGGGRSGGGGAGGRY